MFHGVRVGLATRWARPIHCEYMKQHVVLVVQINVTQTDEHIEAFPTAYSLPVTVCVSFVLFVTWHETAMPSDRLFSTWDTTEIAVLIKDKTLQL